MSEYLLWRRGCCQPVALITHDRQVKRAYGSKAQEQRQIHAVEAFLDNPSELALDECYVTAGAAIPPLFESCKVTPLAVFLDHRKPRKGEVDVRLVERPKKPKKPTKDPVKVGWKL